MYLLSVWLDIGRQIAISKYMCKYTYLYVSVGVCKYVYIGSVATQTHAHHVNATECTNATRCTRRPNGAYGGQVRHARRVPRADVRVERVRVGKCLRADRTPSTRMESVRTPARIHIHVYARAHIEQKWPQARSRRNDTDPAEDHAASMPSHAHRVDMFI